MLVNNAATNPVMGATIDAELPAWDKTFQVNVRGAFVWSQLAWRSWMREHGGSIINLSSIGGLRGDAAIGVYNTTKAAIVHLTKILAVELGPGVRVNCIAPGLVKTDFARALWEPAGDLVAAALPLRRLGEPEDIAHAARLPRRPRRGRGSPVTRWWSTAARSAGATPISARPARPKRHAAMPRAVYQGRSRSNSKSAKCGRFLLQLVDGPAVVGVDRVDDGERLEQPDVAARDPEHPTLDRAVLGGEVGDERRDVARGRARRTRSASRRRAARRRRAWS